MANDAVAGSREDGLLVHLDDGVDGARMAREPIAEILPLAVAEDVEHARLRAGDALFAVFEHAARQELILHVIALAQNLPVGEGEVRDGAVAAGGDERPAVRGARGGRAGGGWVWDGFAGAGARGDVADVRHEIDKGANEPHAVCWRVSHTLTTPSSSPEATRLRSRTEMRFTADLCALERRARGLPVATSVARMLRSELPVRRSAPSLTDPRVRHAPSWHWMFFRRRVEDLSAS